MADLGNAWHIPGSAEPRGRSGMRDPAEFVVAGAALRIRSGNQFSGPGNAANQLQDGSAVLARRAGDAGWTEFPLLFTAEVGNDKYFDATIPGDFLVENDVVSYLLRIAYSDRDTTFIHASGDGSAVTDTPATAQAAPFVFTVASPKDTGRWGAVITLPNVAIHATLLPSGQVLMWGRRTPGPTGDMHVAATSPFRWNPGVEDATTAVTFASELNLFCAGHAFLPDGTLLVAGGHNGADGDGLPTAFRYDHTRDAWTPLDNMNDGRWYPTATALYDGSVLVTSGSHGRPAVNNRQPQVWRGAAWGPVATLPDERAFELYPRIHVTPDGSVVMTGPLAGTWWLTGGTWKEIGERAAGRRDYAPSVQYLPDRVLYVGGGNDNNGPATAACEILPIDTDGGAWTPAAPMSVPRRHHNATVLPDGTVLVTGGTRGTGFNNLDQGQPVHHAELWDSNAGPGGVWSTLAAESADRCYHGTAVLLPDGRVLSAGGGEFLLDQTTPNDPQDSHVEAQVFSPPYLFRGPRPQIVDVPETIDHKSTFVVRLAGGVPVGRVSLLRLGSVTHAMSMDQRFLWLDAAGTDTELTVTAPANPMLCPPGPYLLFVLAENGVPSVGAMVRVTVAPVAPAALLAAPRMDVRAAEPRGTTVVIGIDGVCPYGIGACWGGANEALHRLSGVAAVDPDPDGLRSTAVVHLDSDGLPPLDRWEEDFAATANGSYQLRGYEITLEGDVDRRDGQVLLWLGPGRPDVELHPLRQLIQWDPDRRGREEPTPEERRAFENVTTVATGSRVHVTGPITKDRDSYRLEVRLVRMA